MNQMLYVHPDNPQPRLIQQIVQIIKQGGVVVFPTDSGYAIGCQLGNKKGFERICQIRKVDKKHNFTLICRNLSELSEYAKVTNVQFRLLKNNTPGAYTFILRASKEVPARLINESRKTIGLRVSPCTITRAILEVLEQPMMSCSLILAGETQAEHDPEAIQNLIGKLVDVIVHGGEVGEKPTTVIDLSEDDVVIVREGAGDITPFTM